MPYCCSCCGDKLWYSLGNDNRQNSDTCLGLVAHRDVGSEVNDGDDLVTVDER